MVSMAAREACTFEARDRYLLPALMSDVYTITKKCQTCGSDKLLTISPQAQIGKLIRCEECIALGKEPAMKIVRKEFRHPNGKTIIVEKEVEEGFWRKKVKKKVEEWYAFTYSEVVGQVVDFVNGIGSERLVGVTEYTTAKDRIGDDGITHFVVWYWEVESQTPSVSPTS